ncbi:hypothetical protein YK18_03665 [Salmonella enterica subsp. enterica serovar Enteritidis]|nr:hypothetical protein [Salmonella enterica subsp. enterica serovar Enteritidis]
MYNEYELVYQTPKEAFFNAVITNSIVLLGMQFNIRSMAYSDVTWQDCACLPQKLSTVVEKCLLDKGEVKCRLGHHVSDLAPWVELTMTFEGDTRVAYLSGNQNIGRAIAEGNTMWVHYILTLLIDKPVFELTPDMPTLSDSNWWIGGELNTGFNEKLQNFNSERLDVDAEVLVQQFPEFTAYQITTVWNRAVSKRRFYTKNAPREAAKPVEIDEDTKEALRDLVTIANDSNMMFWTSDENANHYFGEMLDADVWSVMPITEPGNLKDYYKVEKDEVVNEKVLTLLAVFREVIQSEILLSIYKRKTPASENDTAWVFDCRPTNTISPAFWIQVTGKLQRVNSYVVSRLPDSEMRSVAEPAYLMSAKAVRDAWRTNELKQWHYDAIIKWGVNNGWKEVTKYGRQLLFVADLRLL